MDTKEAKILHGLYYQRQMVGEEVPYEAGEIAWLASVSFAKGREWQGPDGKLQRIATPADDFLQRLAAVSADAQRPLRYLDASGYIRFSTTGGIRISITAKGADLARELDSLHGRLNLLYKENKDGLLWFVATVLVSIITTLITNGAG